jgi:hypothetical protein
MRTKLQAILTILPAVAMALGPTFARAADDDAIEVETSELPDEARYELSRAEPGRGDAREVDVPESERDRGDVEFDDFYAGLSSHGNWVETPEYGWVWVPYRQTQVQNWRPYLYGQWVWTKYGWTWVSEEPFGWATYHYGRWAYAPAWGWYWVPGYTWGPAWVVWRYGDAAVGWAPLYPGYVSWTASYPFYWDHWVFIGPRYFYAYPVHRHWYHRHDVVVHHYHGTRWAHHWHHDGHGHGGHHRVYAGPRRSYVERVSSRPVRAAEIRTSSRPDRSSYTATSSGGRVSMYRPDVRGAVKPSGPRPPRSAVANVSSAAGRRPVGSGLDKPRSQATVRGATPAARGTATPERANVRASSAAEKRAAPAVRTPAGTKASRSAAPKAESSKGKAVSPKVRTPAPSKSTPSRIGTPSRESGKAIRSPGASYAPSPRSTGPSRSAVRSPGSSSTRSLADVRAAPRASSSAPRSPSVAPRASSPSSKGYAPSSSGSSKSSGARLSASSSSRSRSISPGRVSAPSRSSAPRATPRVRVDRR